MARLSRLARVWHWGFVPDITVAERPIRALTIVDDYSRECPAIEVDTSLGGVRLERVHTKQLEFDTGTEITEAQYERIAPVFPVQRGNVSLSNLQVLKPCGMSPSRGASGGGCPAGLATGTLDTLE